jgi:tetratricopeptide (TPR) repeat protein
MKGYEKVLGKRHPDTLESINCLATVLHEQRKYMETENLYQQVLKDRREILGNEHPDTLTSVSNLASVLRDQTRYEEAEQMNRRALEGREKVLGAEHPDTLTSVSILALVLQDQRRYEEAEQMNRRALEGYEKGASRSDQICRSWATISAGTKRDGGGTGQEASWNGAELEVKGGLGLTPLLWAAWKGHVDVVRQLLDEGANIEEKTKEHEVTIATLRLHASPWFPVLS